MLEIHHSPEEVTVIKLTRLNNSVIVVNSDLIEYVEAIPDTIITLTTGQKLMVKETVDEVIERTIHYKRNVLQGPVKIEPAP